jgi:hypothetical protein
VSKKPIAHQNGPRTVATVLAVLIVVPVIWAPVVSAGDIRDVLLNEPDPFPWLAAAMATPFIVFLAARKCWRAIRWQGLAIFIEGDQLWLDNRNRPISLPAGAEFELAPPSLGIPFWPPSLIVRVADHTRRVVLPFTTESPAEVIANLRAHAARSNFSTESAPAER